MKRISLLATAALLMAGSAALAEGPVPESSDSLSVFSKNGEWTIYADKSRNTCLAERVDPAGNVMQMGIMPSQTEGYVGVFTPAPIEVKPKQKIEIAVDGTIFAGEARGLVSLGLSKDYKGGYVVSNNPDFVNAIANGRELVAFPQSSGSFVLDLTGTKRAIENIKKCYAAQ